MGAKPVTAMNLVFFPACSLPGEVLRDILAGGQSILREAGVTLVGGHTVEDDELKYGLSVTGLVSPNLIIRNSTARPGDVLILTKPLGSGIISTSIKGEMANPDTVKEAVKWMTTLNLEAALLMSECHATAATDVTGFGLIGHACEMARGAGVTFSLEFSSIPLMSGVTELVSDGMVPAGCYRNRDHYQQFTQSIALTGESALLPLFDPQTSGGLMITLTPDDAERFTAAAANLGIFARRIGSVLTARTIPIEIV